MEWSGKLLEWFEEQKEQLGEKLGEWLTPNTLEQVFVEAKVLILQLQKLTGAIASYVPVVCLCFLIFLRILFGFIGAVIGYKKDLLWEGFFRHIASWTFGVGYCYVNARESHILPTLQRINCKKCQIMPVL